MPRKKPSRRKPSESNDFAGLTSRTAGILGNNLNRLTLPESGPIADNVFGVYAPIVGGNDTVRVARDVAARITGLVPAETSEVIVLGQGEVGTVSWLTRGGQENTNNSARAARLCLEATGFVGQYGTESELSLRIGVLRQFKRPNPRYPSHNMVVAQVYDKEKSKGERDGIWRLRSLLLGSLTGMLEQIGEPRDAAQLRQIRQPMLPLAIGVAEPEKLAEAGRALQQEVRDMPLIATGPAHLIVGLHTEVTPGV